MHSKSTTTNNGNNTADPPAPPTYAAGESAGSREFHNLIQDVEDLAKAMTSLSDEELARAKSALSDRIGIAKHSIGAISDSVTQRARAASQVTDNYVHEQPWKSIGIAATVGLFTGYLLSRRG